MISIYNETDTSWFIDTKGEEPVSNIKKVTQLPHAQQGNGSRSVYMMIYNSAIKNMDTLKDALEHAVRMTKPYRVLEDKTSLMFNKKELAPLISNTGHDKHLAIVSLKTNRRRVVNVRTQEAFFLKYSITPTEFSFIASMNAANSKVAIYLLDEKTKKVTVYEFTQADDRSLVVNTHEVAVEDLGFVPSKKYQFKVFRPRRITTLVLAHPATMETVKERLDATSHVFVEVTNTSFDDTVKGLLDSNYRAVSYAVTKTKREETITDKKRSKVVLDKLSACFPLVYKVYSDGHIEKVKC